MKTKTFEKRKSSKIPTGKQNQHTRKNALEKSITEKSAPNKVIELGIFVDSAALALFMPYFGTQEYVKLRELVLAFVNAVRKFLININSRKITFEFDVDASALPPS